MNKQIQDLADQAGIWCPTQEHNTWVKGEFIASPGELSTFAKLIVTRVFDKIDELGFEVYEPVVKAVKTHFGVE